MIVLLSIAAVTVLGIFVLRRPEKSDGAALVGILISVIGSIALAVALSVLVFGRAEQTSWIVEYKEFRRTIEEARRGETLTDIERAAILKEIVQKNAYIMSARYWNRTAFDIWWLDEFETLEPMR